MKSKKQAKDIIKLLHKFQAECFRGTFTLLKLLFDRREELSDAQHDQLLTMAYISLRSLIITQFGSDNTLHLDKIVNSLLLDFRKGLKSNKNFDEIMDDLISKKMEEVIRLTKNETVH